MRVLVAYDGSPQSQEALDHALEAFPTDTDLIAVYVIDPASQGYASTEEFPMTSGAEWSQITEEQSEEVLDQARDRAGDREIETDTIVGRPGAAIVEYAQDHAVDHVVTGSHGRTGMARLLLGSVAERIVRRSPVPVTVVR